VFTDAASRNWPETAFAEITARFPQGELRARYGLLAMRHRRKYL
jgi:hypothetical protein